MISGLSNADQLPCESSVCVVVFASSQRVVAALSASGASRIQPSTGFGSNRRTARPDCRVVGVSARSDDVCASSQHRAMREA
jgi:hypothetical protein